MAPLWPLPLPAYYHFINRRCPACHRTDNYLLLAHRRRPSFKLFTLTLLITCVTPQPITTARKLTKKSSTLSHPSNLDLLSQVFSSDTNTELYSLFSNSTLSTNNCALTLIPQSQFSDPRPRLNNFSVVPSSHVSALEHDVATTHTRLTDVNSSKFKLRDLSDVPLSRFRDIINVILAIIGCSDTASQIILIHPWILKNCNPSNHYSPTFLNLCLAQL